MQHACMTYVYKKCARYKRSLSRLAISKGSARALELADRFEDNSTKDLMEEVIYADSDQCLEYLLKTRCRIEPINSEWGGKSEAAKILKHIYTTRLDATPENVLKYGFLKLFMGCARLGRGTCSFPSIRPGESITSFLYDSCAASRLAMGDIKWKHIDEMVQFGDAERVWTYIRDALYSS